MKLRHIALSLALATGASAQNQNALPPAAAPAAPASPARPSPGQPPPSIAAQEVPLNSRGLGIVDAVQFTVNINPLLQEQVSQVDYAKGSLLVQKSIFDTNVGSTITQGRQLNPLTKASQLQALQEGINTGSDNVNTTSTNLTGSQLLSNGISIAPSIQLTRNTDNLTNQTGLNNATVSVQVTLPLLRNRGHAAIAAQEIAAGIEVDASTYDLSQLASQLIANTAGAFWAYVGAVDSVSIYRQSEQRGRELLDAVRQLAAADQIPRSEIDDAVANLASRAASLVTADQNVVQAQQNLAIAIGLPPSQIALIPPPADSYPDIGNGQPVATTPDALQHYIQLALTRRADYLAAKRRTEEYTALQVGAKNQLKPELNGILTMGYSGLQETTRFDKYLSSVFQNIYGPAISGGLQYQFPLQNRAARGQLMQIESTLRQTELKINDTARNIASSVVTAAVGLNASALTLVQARQASAAYLSSLEGQREKLRLGVGSMIDIIETEDRYISAALSEISAKVGYGQAIANFRFATGTYLQPDQPVQSVDRSAFYIPLTQ